MANPVLYVYDGKMTHTGIDAVVRRQLEAFAQINQSVHLVSRGRANMEHVTDTVVPRTVANLFSWLPRPWFYPLQKRRLGAKGASVLSRKGPWSMVISWPQRALRPFRAAHRLGIPCYLNHDTMHYQRAHSSGKWPSWPGYRAHEYEEEYRLSHKILAPSPYSLETFIQNGVPEEKMFMLGRGADLSQFYPSFQKESDAPFRLLFCGRVCERKGIRQVLASWLCADLKHAELWVVGKLDKELENLPDESSGNVRWFGHRSDLPELMRQCDAQILLSRHEGMAKSLVEGAASGLVTLCTDRCGFPLREGINGFEVKRNDVQKVAAHLQFLAKNREVCRQMGLTASEDIRQSWTWECFQKRFLTALQLPSEALPAEDSALLLLR